MAWIPFRTATNLVNVTERRAERWYSFYFRTRVHVAPIRTLPASGGGERVRRRCDRTSGSRYTEVYIISAGYYRTYSTYSTYTTYLTTGGPAHAHADSTMYTYVQCGDYSSRAPAYMYYHSLEQARASLHTRVCSTNITA